MLIQSKYITKYGKISLEDQDQFTATITRFLQRIFLQSRIHLCDPTILIQRHGRGK